MKASDIMTRDVRTLSPEATIDDAVSLLLSIRASGLPVVDARGKLVGIVSETDFLHRVEIGTEKRRARWIEFLLGPGEIAEAYVMSHSRKVSDIITHDVVTVTAGASLNEIVAVMEKRKVKRVPVVTGDELVGIITRSDLLRAMLASRRAAAPAAPLNDQAILETLIAELKAQGFASPRTLDVAVDHGEVSLSGEIFDERQRAALVCAAENIPGVTKVVDHLVWIEPFSGMTLENKSGIM